MSESLTIEGNKFSPAALVGKRFGYTGTYMLMLAKEGKIDGQKIGNKWYISVSSAEQFFTDVKRAREARNEEVSRKRKAELRAHENMRKTTHGHRALVETLAILIIGLTLGSVGYLGATTASNQVANVSGAGSSFFERLAVAFYRVISPLDATVPSEPASNGASPEPSVSMTVGTTTRTSLVIAPDEIMTTTTIETVRDSLSDDVSVSLDPRNPDTGVIVPHFKNKDGEAYRFLLVPLDAGSARGTGASNRMTPINTGGG